MVTEVFGAPRSMSTASLRAMFTVLSKPICTTLSPALSPAREAGVSSMGLTTVSCPSRTLITMPRPPNLPRVESFISR